MTTMNTTTNKAAPMNATTTSPTNGKGVKGANVKRDPAPIKGRRAATAANDKGSKGANATNTIKQLLIDLGKATTTDDKKGIRRQLRRAGHYGGARVKGLIVSKADAIKQIKAKA